MQEGFPFVLVQITGNFMKRIILAAVFALATQAQAGPLTDSALFGTTNHYARMRGIEEGCKIERKESTTFKARVISRLMLIPMIDLAGSENQMVKLAHQEINSMMGGCFDGAKDSYAKLIDHQDFFLGRLDKAISTEF